MLISMYNVTFTGLQVFYPDFYSDIVYKPIMKKMTAGNIVRHSAHYLNHEENIMYIVMNHR